ncbi:MAG: hypothetical protein H7Y17_16680 [Chlorobia bacterium]|nr:hypothetical protein [Fimbriimonadaceae bacterium]
MLGKLLLILFCPTVLSTPVLHPGSVDDFGNISYKTPSGWAAKTSGSELHVAPSKLDPGESCQIVLYPGSKQSGEFKVWFSEEWSRFKKSFTVGTENELISQKDDQGNDTLIATASLETSGKSYLAIYLGVHVGSTYQPFSFLCSSDAFDKYHGAAEQFFKDLTFKAAGSPDPKPPQTAYAAGPLPTPAPMPAGTLAIAAKGLAQQIRAGSLPALMRAMLASGISIKNIRNEVVYRPEKGEALGFAINEYDFRLALQAQSQGMSYDSESFESIISGPEEWKLGIVLNDVRSSITRQASSGNAQIKFFSLLIQSLLDASGNQGTYEPVAQTLVLHQLAYGSILAELKKAKHQVPLRFQVGAPPTKLFVEVEPPQQNLMTDSFIDQMLAPKLTDTSSEIYSTMEKAWNASFWDKVLEAQANNPGWKKMTYAEYIARAWLARFILESTSTEIEKGTGRLIRTKVKGQEGASLTKKVKVNFKVDEVSEGMFNARADTIGLKSRVVQGSTDLSAKLLVEPHPTTAPNRLTAVTIVNPRLEANSHAGATIEFKGARQTKTLGLGSPPDNFSWGFLIQTYDVEYPDRSIAAEFGSILSLVGKARSNKVGSGKTPGNSQESGHALLVTDWLQPGWSGSVSYGLHGQASGKDWSAKIARTGALEFVMNDGLPRSGFPVGLTRAEMDQPGRFYTWRASDSEGLASINDMATYMIDDACVDVRKRLRVTITDGSRSARLKSRDYVYLMLDNVAKKAYFKIPNLNDIPYLHTMTGVPKPPKPVERKKDIFTDTKYAAMGQIVEIPWSMIEAGKVTVDFEPDPDPTFVNYGSKPVAAKLTIKITLSNTSGN